MAETEFIPELMRPARFARLVDMSRSKIYDLVAAGELRAVRVGGTSIRIPRSEVDRLVNAALVSGDDD